MSDHHLQLLHFCTEFTKLLTNNLVSLNKDFKILLKYIPFLKVILNQKLYHVFLFQHNFYFYHDIQAVSFNKVKGVNPIEYK